MEAFYLEPPDDPELPDGWWAEDQVAEAEAELARLRSAVALADQLLAELTKTGWLDKASADIHPDTINAACDAVRKAAPKGD